MTREIKFRAYIKNQERMCGWDGVDGVRTYFREMSLDKDVCLMQFTGLKDKTGKEIYEGDVVRWHDTSEDIDKGWSRTAIVEIGPDLFFHCFDIGGKEHNRDFHYGNFIWKETEKYFEVLGNIYQNPELIK